MKKKIIIATLIVLFTLIIGGICYRKKDLYYGTYYANDEKSYLELNSDGTFYFCISILRGYNPSGIYNVEDESLILIVEELAEEYRFKIKNRKLIFESSSYEIGIEKGETYKLKKK